MKLTQAQLRTLVTETMQGPQFEVMDPQEIIESDPEILDAATALYEAVGGKLNEIMASEFGDVADTVDPFEIADRHIRAGVRAAFAECMKVVQGQ